MPYLQLFVEKDLTEAEAQQALAFAREHFPLRQSEGRVVRVAPAFLLIEQPEHTVLTLEQELWLEKHAQDAHLHAYVQFYQDKTQGCRLCNHPFDDAPTGYCPQCHYANPFHITLMRLPLTKEEDTYLSSLAQSICGGNQNEYFRLLLLTFLDVLEAGQIGMEQVLSFTPAQLTEKASAFVQQQRTTCFLCGLPDEQCTCAHSPFRYQRQHEAIAALFPQDYFAMVSLPRPKARRMQELAEQHELTIDTLVRLLVQVPDLQMAIASREAAAGQVLSVDFVFQLARIAEQKAQGFPQDGRVRAIRDTAGNTFSPTVFHLGGLAASLATIFPLLEASLPALLFDLPHALQGERALVWIQEQLATCDAQAAEKAQPCTLQEIAELTVLAGWPLPAVYQSFLTRIGRGAGAFFQALRCFFADLPAIQTEARQLLATNHCPSSLSDDAWVLAMVPGQHFTFFRLSEGDDPPVYAYRSEWQQTPFRRIAHHLSDFFCLQFALYARYRQDEAFQTSPGKELRTHFLAMAPRIEAALTDQRNLS